MTQSTNTSRLANLLSASPSPPLKSSSPSRARSTSSDSDISERKRTWRFYSDNSDNPDVWEAKHVQCHWASVWLALTGKWPPRWPVHIQRHVKSSIEGGEMTGRDWRDLITFVVQNRRELLRLYPDLEDGLTPNFLWGWRHSLLHKARDPNWKPSGVVQAQWEVSNPDNTNAQAFGFSSPGGARSAFS